MGGDEEVAAVVEPGEGVVYVVIMLNLYGWVAVIYLNYVLVYCLNDYLINMNCRYY